MRPDQPSQPKSTPTEIDESQHWAVGKYLHFLFDSALRRGRCGWYMGKVAQVCQLKTGQVTSVTIHMANTETMRHDGEKIKLTPGEFQAKYACIEFEGKRLDINGKELKFDDTSIPAGTRSPKRSA